MEVSPDCICQGSESLLPIERRSGLGLPIRIDRAGLLEGQVDPNVRTNPPDTPHPWEGHLAPTGRIATWRSLLQRRKQSGFVNPDRAGRGMLGGQIVGFSDAHLILIRRSIPTYALILPTHRTRGRDILPRLEESRPGGRSYKGESGLDLSIRIEQEGGAD